MIDRLNSIRAKGGILMDHHHLKDGNCRAAKRTEENPDQVSKRGRRRGGGWMWQIQRTRHIPNPFAIHSLTLTNLIHAQLN